MGSSEHLHCQIWGQVGLAILKSQHGGGPLRFESPAISQKSVLARELLAISVRIGAAGDVATQIASDSRPRVEGHQV